MLVEKGLVKNQTPPPVEASHNDTHLVLVFSL
jgi:hypothetical protein